MQRKAIMDENDVLCQIVDCYQSNKDNKEYESYNGIENVLKFDNKYLIRVKIFILERVVQIIRTISR